MAKKQRKSSLAKAMEKKPRKIHGPFQLPPGFTTHASTDVAEVKVRVLVKTEEDKALVAAHKMRNGLIIEGAESALHDSDLLADNKAIFALYKSMRDADDHMYTAFFDQEWMRGILTTDKIQYLLNVYFACRELEEVMRWKIDPLKMEEKLESVADADPESALPEVLIADCSDTWLRQAFILCSYRLRAERRALYRTRQLLAMSVQHVREVVPTADNAKALNYWGTAVAGELSAEEPWGTKTIVEQGWIGLDPVDYGEAREVLVDVCAAAREVLPDMTPEEEAELDAILRGSERAGADEADEDDAKTLPVEITGEEPPDGAIMVEDEEEPEG